MIRLGWGSGAGRAGRAASRAHSLAIPATDARCSQSNGLRTSSTTGRSAAAAATSSTMPSASRMVRRHGTRWRSCRRLRSRSASTGCSGSAVPTAVARSERSCRRAFRAAVSDRSWRRRLRRSRSGIVSRVGSWSSCWTSCLAARSRSGRSTRSSLAPGKRSSRSTRSCSSRPGARARSTSTRLAGT